MMHTNVHHLRDLYLSFKAHRAAIRIVLRDVRS